MADTPIVRALHRLADTRTDNMRWLEQAGPIAARLNEEARRENEAARD